MPARYLLRLGMGEQELATTLDFSRVGRVNAMLARRLELLAEVLSGSTSVTNAHQHDQPSAAGTKYLHLFGSTRAHAQVLWSLLC